MRCSLWSFSASTPTPPSTFHSILGRTTYNFRPKYLQQASATKKVFGPGEIEAHRRWIETPQLSTVAREALEDFDRKSLDGGRLHTDTNSSLRLRPELLPATADVSKKHATTFADEDDDVVVESLVQEDSLVASSSDSSLAEAGLASRNVAIPSKQEMNQQRIPAASSKVSPSLIDLVTDEFRAIREREVDRRRKFLYRLTHPDPLDYTYGGKLVPPPPLAFGTVTPESIDLGNKMMLGQPYSLVRSASSSDYFFEINDLYMEVVFAGKANAGKSSLINALLGQPGLAKTSSQPNSTRQVSFYQSATPDQLAAFANRNPNKLVTLPGGGMQLTFVDLPGFGITGMSESWRDNAIQCTDAYLGVRRSVNTVFLCIDCERGLTKGDATYMEWLENLHGIFWIILTKCDDVPHSRVCTVMKQCYQLITKFRRKYRKAFPFILPVSAKDGTNLDVLRGLIMETSGIIPGERLREMLRAKAKLHVDEASQLEEAKLWDMWRKEREGRRLKGTSSDHTSLQPADASQSLPSTKPQSVVLSLDTSPPAAAEVATPKERVTLPYGGTRVKLNDGLQGADSKHVAVEWGGATSPVDQLGMVSDEAVVEAMQSSGPLNDQSGNEQGGVVTKYLKTLETMSNSVEQKRGSKRSRSPTRGRARLTQVIAPVADGRLAEHKAGRPVGPLILPDGSESETAASKAAAWKAKRYAQLAQSTSPTAPWNALPKLKQKEDELRQGAAISKMKAKELAAYLKNRGRVVEGFERFDNEVKMSKYMNEHRQVETLRRKEQWELNAETKINYRSQPPGLLKAYGEKDTFWPTSSVLGL